MDLKNIKHMESLIKEHGLLSKTLNELNKILSGEIESEMQLEYSTAKQGRSILCLHGKDHNNAIMRIIAHYYKNILDGIEKLIKEVQ